MSDGYGNGKVILFGEHFVVHGASAIVAAISNRAIVKVRKNSAKENRIITELRVIPSLSTAGIARVLSSLNISDTYDVYLTGDLPTYGGLGSSAAFCVALTRAFAIDAGMKLSDDDVNRHAYEGEKSFHGNPSGVDNLAATYGSVFEFTRGKNPSENRFQKLQLTKSLDLVVSFTGKYSGTPKMVAKVKNLKETSPSKFEKLLAQYNDLFNQGKIALSKGKLDELGILMTKNHQLLQQLGTSDPLNDQIVELARKNGALGAKVTGGGGGGVCISLVKTESEAKELAILLTKAGFESFATRISTS
ncbi:mevalonate kinase [Candidatus Micrarchaeota archaeon]|nr:mevalonate kinase [Candidatus Micrarchaeota archaeon]